MARKPNLLNSNLPNTNKKNAATIKSPDGKKKNILDDFFRGIDRGNALQNDPMYNNSLWKGHGWSAEEILNSEGITLSRLTSKILNTTRININHAPSQVDFTNFGKMYVFFTMPDLFLFSDSKLTVNQSIRDNHPDLHAKILKNVAVARTLQGSLTASSHPNGIGGFNYLLGNLCNEISAPDIGMSLTQGPKNMKGFGISYLGDFHESLQEGDIEISFIDTRDRDIQNLMEIWTMYAEGVRNGTIYMKPDYIGKNIIDYACSAYIIAVDESMNIKYMGGLIGLFPRTLNTQLMQYTAELLRAQSFIGPFNYTFHVSHVARPNTQRLVESFNYVSGYSNIIVSKTDKTAHELMYKSVNGYYHHTGVTMDVGFLTEYPYHFSLTDKWAEIAGISWNVKSSGAIDYTLAFVSKDLGNPVDPTSFWKGEKAVATSRWKDGKYMRAKYYGTGKNDYKWEEIGTSSDAEAFRDTSTPFSYGNLNNVGIGTPYGVSKGRYQGGWQNWNSGNRRYGDNYGLQADNNANVFRNTLRGLFRR